MPGHRHQGQQATQSSRAARDPTHSGMGAAHACHPSRNGRGGGLEGRQVQQIRGQQQRRLPQQQDQPRAEERGGAVPFVMGDTEFFSAMVGDCDVKRPSAARFAP